MSRSDTVVLPRYKKKVQGAEQVLFRNSVVSQTRRAKLAVGIVAGRLL